MPLPMGDSPGLFSREWIETKETQRRLSLLGHSPGLFSREWIETSPVATRTPKQGHSPGLFSREWIETLQHTSAHATQLNILPAYLVGSGLKRINQCIRLHTQKFSRLI